MRTVAVVAVLAVPVVLILVQGWSHRWLNEDAYINLRVVDQIYAGNGPVFNVGERVEVATSPAWIGVLCVGRATLGLFLRMEWVAILASFAAAVAAFVVAARATRLLHPGRDIVVPLGLIFVAAVPVVWDFSTSGLEIGAVWLWIALCWWALVRAGRMAEPPTGWSRAALLALLGFGPLIRPDLAVMSVCLLAAWWVITQPDRRSFVLDVVAAGALPVLYQLFRMGYYASLVPNTALAKDASGVHLRQGATYLGDLLTAYWLWIPLLIIAVVVGWTIASADRKVRAACIGMVAAGVTHAAYMVVSGGDYMHGRLLLPALFAVAVPAAVELRREHLARGAALVLVGATWAVVCAVGLRYQQAPSSAFVPDISDWRLLMPPEDRVVAGDHPSEGSLSPGQLADLADAGHTGFVRPLSDEVEPAASDGRLVTMFGSIGVPGYRVGIEVWVIDIGGLGEPLAARTSVVPGRPAGHRKQVDAAWYEARWDVETPVDPAAAQAADEALDCGPISDLLDAVNEPLTPGRFLSNMWNSARFTRLHVPSDPRDAPGC
jgi:arabinofuranosyltransferase